MRLKHPIRVITATAIFDGHDASINIVRRLLQERGVEVIHLGHNRCVREMVKAAIEEDVDALCISSYQGGHLEYFEYLAKELNTQGVSHIKVFAGGGGTISEPDAEKMIAGGVTRVYTAKNSVQAGLGGIADEIVSLCVRKQQIECSETGSASDIYELSKKITRCQDLASPTFSRKKTTSGVIGITGTGGSGKSTLIDELISRVLLNSKIKVACIAIDPSREKTGGALLGDRIRINNASHPRVYFRSIATRQSNTSITPVLNELIHLIDAYGYDLIIIETSGIGQSDNLICKFVDHSTYVMSADYGAPGQLEKISMLDYADSIVLNKCDHRGSKDALNTVGKQWLNNRSENEPDDIIPVFGVRANHYNDAGVDEYINYVTTILFDDQFVDGSERARGKYKSSYNNYIIPVNRQNYLSEISRQARDLKKYNQLQCYYAEQVQFVYETLSLLENGAEFDLLNPTSDEIEPEDKTLEKLRNILKYYSSRLDESSVQLLEQWEDKRNSLLADCSVYTLSHETRQHRNYETSLSNSKIPVIAAAKYTAWKDQLGFLQNENLPGSFPFTAGSYPYRNTEEDPTRMFAGEGTPEETNRRFFLIKQGQKSVRLSTAFDPLVLYAKDPSEELDAYGCIGMSGVSISTIDDMKKLYSGINLCDKSTSVSMTINGPAAIVMAFYMNVAIDQQVEVYLQQKKGKEELGRQLKDIRKRQGRTEVYKGELPDEHNGLGLALLGIDVYDVIDRHTYEKISRECCRKIRGTLQADILKEEQAQNECLYSLEFSLKLMSDIQKYFIEKDMKHFYSVSVSGYHIAEAGANPVTQLAFTLANAFTLIEYYLTQGMNIDEFAPRFSFFFSNGMDAEYAVIGRVARRIWSRALKYVYKAGENSQKLKYHIQTSGRSLQAQDIDFNDIRTSLQALYAINDNCNSLHTNAYDEAVTTPTDGSLRRALAIQLIINRELGLSLNQNPLQGSYFITELTDIVEQAVYDEFDRLSERGGVVGAMEYFYQRNKIQEESMVSERYKQSGKTVVVGVNQFIDTVLKRDKELACFTHSSQSQKQQQIEGCKLFKANNQVKSRELLKKLSSNIAVGENSFTAILAASRYCTLQQISDVLLESGGQYRRII